LLCVCREMPRVVRPRRMVSRRGDPPRIRVRTSKPGCCTRCCSGDIPPGGARPPAALRGRRRLAQGRTARVLGSAREVAGDRRLLCVCPPRIRVRTSKPGCCTRCCSGDIPPGGARPPAAAPGYDSIRNNLAKTPLFTRCMVRCLRVIRRVLDVQSDLDDHLRVIQERLVDRRESLEAGELVLRDMHARVSGTTSPRRLSLRAAWLGACALSAGYSTCRAPSSRYPAVTIVRMVSRRGDPPRIRVRTSKPGCCTRCCSRGGR
jgi:hypothetical protein